MKHNKESINSVSKGWEKAMRKSAKSKARRAGKKEARSYKEGKIL